MYISSSLVDVFNTTLLQTINSASSNSIALFSGPMPTNNVIRTTPVSDFLLSGTLLAKLLVAGTSVLPAEPPITNDGIDIIFDTYSSTPIYSVGICTWFLFDSDDSLKVFGTAGLQGSGSDMSMLDNDFQFGRVIDFQNLKIRFSQKFFSGV